MKRTLMLFLFLCTVGSGAWFMSEKQAETSQQATIQETQDSLSSEHLLLVRLEHELKARPAANTRVLPVGPQEPEFIDMVDQAAKSSGVSLQSSSYSYGPETAVGGQNAANAASQGPYFQSTLVIEGDSQNLLKFVHTLQNVPRPVLVTNASLNLAAKPAQLTLTMNLPYTQS